MPSLFEQVSGQPRELILSDIAELLRAEYFLDESLRGKLFAIYARFAAPQDVVALALQIANQSGEIEWLRLGDYFDRLDAPFVFKRRNNDQSGNSRSTPQILASSLIRLMNELPEDCERERLAAARLFSGLPPNELVDLFVTTFSGEIATSAEQSLRIYINAVPGDRQSEQANQLMAELGRKLMALTSSQKKENELHVDELEYVLTGVHHLLPYSNHRNEALLGKVRHLLESRSEFSAGSILAAACRTYAAMYRKWLRSESSDVVALTPLRSILVDDGMDHAEGVPQGAENWQEMKNSILDRRRAAAESLGETGELAFIADLAKVARSPNEGPRLRMSAIKGLAAIGNARRQQNQDVHDVAAAFREVLLLDVKQYEMEPLLSDVAIKYANVAELAGLKDILALLSLQQHNFSAQHGILPFIFRFPEATHQIAKDTLEALAMLSDEQKEHLYPPPTRIFGELSQFNSGYTDAEVGQALRNLAGALAKISTLDNDLPVRKLAHQNLLQILAVVTMQQSLDPSAPAAERDLHWTRWQAEWSQREPRLILNATHQLAVPQSQSQGH